MKFEDEEMVKVEIKLPKIVYQEIVAGRITIPRFSLFETAVQEGIIIDGDKEEIMKDYQDKKFL